MLLLSLMNKYFLCCSFPLFSCAMGVASSVVSANFEEQENLVPSLDNAIAFNGLFNANPSPCSKGNLLNGIFLTGPKTTLSQEDKEALAKIRDVEVRNLEVPDGIGNLKQFLEPLFIHQCLTSELIVEIKNAIIRYFRNHGHPVIAIDVPEQEITDGVLHLIITEGKLGTLITRGNRWFSSKLLKSDIRLKPGEPIDTDILLEDLAWMNRNPFHETNLIFTPGSEDGMTDVELITKDRFPLRFYAGADNTGTIGTGQARLFGGFNWGNAFGCDQQLTYQATFSADGNRFRANTVNYVAPLPWRHILQIYGGYSVIRPRHDHSHSKHRTFHSKGRSFQSSLRYTVPIPPTYKGKEHEWVAGIDYKNTNNNLAFIEPHERPIITNEVNIFQLMVGYNLGIALGKHEFAFSGEVFGSPGDFLPHQSNRAYNHLRRGAQNTYAYGRLMVSELYQLPKRWALFFQARGQLSSTSLLPSEQFGLGGYDTVRGYDEREVNADSGCCGNFEFRTPAFPFFLFRSTKFKDSLYLLAFADYGLSIEYTHVPGRIHTQQLCSSGPGLRYRLGNYVSLRVDVGYRFVPVHEGQGKGWKTHLGALISY